ncbi:pinin [Amyelois transitella]|uniref:pinin n=1 Tax=Amyelois transitella TaxID=680683 RepID=UPI00067D2287|nr:pinin [Amyelois transitella]
MGTEVAISFSSLRAQLESEKSSLFKIDENIKKIQVSGRFPNDRFNNSSGEYVRAGNRLGGRNSFPDAGNNYKNDELYNKRKHETKTVFSRLSARSQDSDGEEEGPGGKRARMPSAVTRELPTRAAVLRAQGDDEQARTRNRRIFGSLLGTLQKFKQEEIVLQTKEEKKAQVERKIEEQARQEKEREQRERKTLYAEREHKKATIKALEAKMARVEEFERWEASQKHLANFILTKAKPHIYWLPKKMTDKATEKLTSSRKFHEKCMSKKRQELQDELQRIEQRCLRPRAPGTKENLPQPRAHVAKEEEGEKSRRNKFAADADQKEDSDADDHHDDNHHDDAHVEVQPRVEEVSDDLKADTITDQNTASIDANTSSDHNTSIDCDTSITNTSIEAAAIDPNTSMVIDGQNTQTDKHTTAVEEDKEEMMNIDNLEHS